MKLWLERLLGSDQVARVLEFLHALATELVRCIAPGWLSGSRETHGGSRWARPVEATALGRISRAGQSHGDGIVLGWFCDRLLQTPREDNLLLLGVQRSGKTSAVVLPTLLTWEGAVVATSTKEELVCMTSAARARRGPVWVLAPLDRDLGWISDLGLVPATWNPVDDATDSSAAVEIADQLTADGRRGVATHWYLSASSLIAGLIVLMHERGGDMRSVLTKLNLTRPAEYVEAAGEVQDRTAAELLYAFAHTPEKEAGSVASTARSCLSVWMDERVAAATRSGPNELDLDRLLSEGGSLYLVAPAEEAERCRPLFSALLQSLLRKATARARSQGGVLSPRLLLALDEVANFVRIPRLAGYASTGPGQGIQLLLAFHDLAQIEAGYGAQEARTIWNNCRARLLLPGQGDIQTLERFSRAIGDETRNYLGRQFDSQRTSHSEQRTGRALTSVDELRRMKRAVLLYANAPPAQVDLRRWDEVPHWRSQIPPQTS